MSHAVKVKKKMFWALEASVELLIRVNRWVDRRLDDLRYWAMCKRHNQ